MNQVIKTKPKNEIHPHDPWDFNEPILDIVIDLLKKEKRGILLDAGAGTGCLTKKLADLGFRVSACDLEPECFKPKNILIKKADLDIGLPYPNNSFDYITCTEVLEHLENPWQASRELARVLKKGGILIISLPNFANLVSRWIFFARGNFTQFDEWTWKHWGHINPITYTELSKMFKSVGFEISEIRSQLETSQPYAAFLRLLQKTSSMMLHLFKIVRWGIDRKDKTLSTLETRPLLFGENLIIKCKKQ